MGVINKMLVSLIGTKSQKIHSEFGDVIIRTTREIEEFPEPIKDLMASWLVAFPWSYFEALFINDVSWNKSLLAVLNDAQVINGEECALISQAFCMWLLEQIIKNDNDYRKYSIEDIELWVNKKTAKGTLLTARLKKFRDLSPDDCYFDYIDEIINVLYLDHEKRLSIINALQLDSFLRLALMKCSVDMVAATKRISLQGV